MIEESVLETCLDTLTEDYHDLQSADITTLDQPPSAIEALRMINRSQPVVIKGISPVTTSGMDRQWGSKSTYTEIMGQKPVSIAVTDDGLADSVRSLADGSTTFVKPLEEQMPMETFLNRLTSEEPEVLYLQSQDGNVYRSTPGARGPSELADLQTFIERDVTWMKEATGSSAEAVNLWIGTSRSTTSLHHDPYENLYHVLSGSKTFTLVSPIDGLRIEQRFHRPSTLVRGNDGLEPQYDDASAPDVPWVEGTDIPSHARHIVVTLNEGDSLYLPANWWHRVEQQEGDGGLAVAVNYWYTSELRPEFYAFERFARRIARAAGREVLPVDVDEVDDDVWGSEVDSADEWDPSEWGR